MRWLKLNYSWVLVLVNSHEEIQYHWWLYSDINLKSAILKQINIIIKLIKFPVSSVRNTYEIQPSKAYTFAFRVRIQFKYY